jgi:hypothetical protein
MQTADGRPIVTVGSADYFARLHHRLRERLPMWVVYHPFTREYPGSWVARMHVTLPEPKATRFVVIHDSLEELRTILPPGLTRMARHANDLPEIAEVWL